VARQARSFLLTLALRRAAVGAAVLGTVAAALGPAAVAEADVLVVRDGGLPERRTAWTAEARGTLAARGVALESWEAYLEAREPAPTVERSALDRVAAIERALREARRLAAELREGAALRRLAEAERVVASALAVPGIAAWAAELQLTFAIVARQAGQPALSEASLRRAAVLDPGRRARAAEAPPQLVDTNRAVSEALRVGPRGEFTVEVEGLSGVARVLLDDVPQGLSPATVSASVGRHILQVEGPAYRRWATTLQVTEGRGPPVRVALSPSPLRTAVRALARDARTMPVEGLPARLAQLGASPPVLWVLDVGDGPRDRALLRRCSAAGCMAPERLAAPEDPVSDGAPPFGDGWLREGLPPDPPPWFARPAFWGVVGGVVVLGVLAVSIAVPLASREQAPRPDLWIFDLSRLP
jgi:hypothetical protein